MNEVASPRSALPRPKLRHQMMLVAYFAVLSSVLAPVLNRPGPGAALGVLRVVLLGSPWILGGLVVAFERRGPLRDYVVAGLLFSFYPALMLFLDVSAAVEAARSGVVPRSGGLALFNALMLGASVVFYGRMRPAPCPDCGRRGLVPLMRLVGQSGRFGNTRWCASCGGQYWRDRAGVYRAERRKTWVPAPSPASEPVREVATPSRAG